MKASERSLELIKTFEGFKGKAYQCPGGIWTIGYGHTKGVKPTDQIDKEQAEVFLNEDLKEIQASMEKYIKVELTQNQWDALSSFVFNVGVGNFKESTLLQRSKAKDYIGAALEFAKWDKARGAPSVLEGLNRRRRAERKLFLS